MEAEDNWTATSSPTNIHLYTTASGSLTANKRLTILASGNVGIGTTTPDDALDVNGRIQIAGHGGGTCAAASDGGRIRYNTTTGKLQYCDGVDVGWRTIPSNRTVCGTTTSTYTGSGVGGWSGAKTKCKAATGCTNTADICNEGEIENTLRLGSTGTDKIPTSSAWFGGINDIYFKHCTHWTTTSGDGNTIEILTAGEGSVETYLWESCNAAKKILCCDE
jgi:hypothetical protein